MYPPPLAWRNDRHDPRRDEAAADLGRQGPRRAILARSASLLGVYLQPRVGRPRKATGVLFGTDLIDAAPLGPSPIRVLIRGSI